MRRKDREIKDFSRITAILDTCKVLRLGMLDREGRPYVVPLNFGYEQKEGQVTLYVHSSRQGTKVELLEKNPSVCVEMDTGHELMEADMACKYGFAYASLIGRGNAVLIREPNDKAAALLCLMKHQTGKDSFTFGEKEWEAVNVYSILLEELTGKERVSYH